MSATDSLSADERRALAAVIRGVLDAVAPAPGGALDARLRERFSELADSLESGE